MHSWLNGCQLLTSYRPVLSRSLMISYKSRTDTPELHSLIFSSLDFLSSSFSNYMNLARSADDGDIYYGRGAMLRKSGELLGRGASGPVCRVLLLFSGERIDESGKYAAKFVDIETVRVQWVEQKEEKMRERIRVELLAMWGPEEPSPEDLDKGVQKAFDDYWEEALQTANHDANMLRIASSERPPGWEGKCPIIEYKWETVSSPQPLFLYCFCFQAGLGYNITVTELAGGSLASRLENKECRDEMMAPSSILRSSAELGKKNNLPHLSPTPLIFQSMELIFCIGSILCIVTLNPTMSCT